MIPSIYDLRDIEIEREKIIRREERGWRFWMTAIIGGAFGGLGVYMFIAMLAALIG